MVCAYIHEQWNGNFPFLMASYQYPLCEMITTDSLPATSLKSSPPWRPPTRHCARVPHFCHAGSPCSLQVCGSSQFFILVLMVGFFLFVWFGFLNKIKNAHVAHIINPQYCLTELCVFTQLLTPGIPSWEGDNSSECTIWWISEKYKG